MAVVAGRSRRAGREDLHAACYAARLEPGDASGSADALLGREDELAELLGLADQGRLITLTGPPGVGKSRLSLELARRRAPAHKDGARHVRLLPGNDPVDTVADRLGEDDLLLVLDDCDELLTACAELVDRLLRQCPGLVVVATSRQPLGRPAEQVWRVPPLPVPGALDAQSQERLAANPAVQLFLARAREVQPEFALTPYLGPDIAEITRRLDGMPLAIELAAGRVGDLTPAEIARRLDDRFDLLVAAASPPNSRARSLRSVLDRCHEVLTEAERIAFRRLSVFAGPFTLEAATVVCSSRDLPTERVRELLDGLVAKSLVMLQRVDEGGPSYRLLETFRTYASERLEGSGEQPRLRRDHARYYVALAEDAEPELTGREQDWFFELLEHAHANLRAALEFSLGDGREEWALRLSAALTLFWRVRGHFDEGRDLLAAALASSNGAPPGLKAKAQWGEGFLSLMAGDPYGSVAPLEQSLAHFEQIREPGGQARALLLIGNARQRQGEPGAHELLERSVTLARDAGDAWCLAHALGCLGFERLSHAGSELARPLFEESLQVAEKAGDKQGRRWGLLGLGALAGFEGDYRKAERLLRQGLALVEELGEDYLKAEALRDLGQVALGRGRYADARALLDEAIALTRRFGPPGAVVIVLSLRAQVACAEGDWVAAEGSLDLGLQIARGGAGFASHAVVWMGKATLGLARRDLHSATVASARGLELARASGERWMIAHASHFSGRLSRVQGDLRRAGVLLDEALALYAELGNRRGLAGSLEGIGGLAADAEDWARAVRFLAAADALRESGGTVRMFWETESYHDDLARARAALGGDGFAESLREGARISTDEVVAQALRCPGRGRPAGGWPSLTAREREVALLAGEGLTNPEIADRLVISLGTVKNHLAQVFLKLGISKRSELVRDASRQDLGAFAGPPAGVPKK